MQRQHGCLVIVDAAFAPMLLAACDEEPAKQAERIHAIKPSDVVEPAAPSPASVDP